MSLTINTHGKADAMMADVRCWDDMLRQDEPASAEAIEDAVFGIMSAADYVTKWNEDDPTGLRDEGFTDRMLEDVWSAEARWDSLYFAILDGDVA